MKSLKKPGSGYRQRVSSLKASHSSPDSYIQKYFGSDLLFQNQKSGIRRFFDFQEENVAVYFNS
jgi:hypothetical protein